MVIRPARHIVGRIVGVLALAVGFVVVAPGAALASQPTVTMSPLTVDNEIDTSCGFAVAVHAVVRFIDIVWTDSAGNVRDFEAAMESSVQLTNVATAKTIKVNEAGPGTAYYSTSGEGTFTLVGTGGWGWGHNPDINYPSVPGMFLTEGRFTLTIDPQGNFSVSRVGRLVDLCAELAA